MTEFLTYLEHSWAEYGPDLLTALLILIIGYIVAVLIRWAIAGAIDRLPLVAKANVGGASRTTVGTSIGAAGFWIAILAAIVMALEKVGMTSVSASIRGTLDQIFAYLPQLIGALITFIVFLIVARVARQATQAALNAVQADSLPKNFGFASQDIKLTATLGAIVFVLIVIPGAIAALQTLDIEAITGPSVELLSSVLSAIPNVIIAAIVIGVFALIAKFVRDIIMKTLPNTGFDSAVTKLGLLKGADTGLTASRITADVSGFFILLIGLVQGMNSLGFEPLTDTLNLILGMGARILFGSVIIFAGVLISGIVANAMKSAGAGATDFVAGLVRNIIIVLSVILGLSRMGLDPDGTFITNAAQILLIGAALAGGIAFGLGGKEWAARQLEKLGK